MVGSNDSELEHSFGMGGATKVVNPSYNSAGSDHHLDISVGSVGAHRQSDGRSGV